MKSFKTMLNEIKLGKARRLIGKPLNRANSKRAAEIQTAINAARGRMDARAMTASIDGDHQKASQIASGIDLLSHERAVASRKSLNATLLKDKPMKMPDRDTSEGEYYATGPAANIEKRQTAMNDLLRHLPQRNPADAFITATPFVQGRITDASRVLGTNTSREISKKNLFNHIMRSRLAGAAVRSGFSADDVPAFQAEKPIRPQMLHNKNKKYPPFDK